METNSTQAVTPTSTTAEPSVKRLRRGDVREDGKVFWRTAGGKNEWLSAEVFSRKLAKSRDRYLKNRRAILEYAKLRYAENREARLEYARLKYAELRSQRLITVKAYRERNRDKIRARQRGYNKEHREERKAYDEAIKGRRNARRRERRATDPLYATKERVRSRVSSFLKSKGLKKSMRTAAMLGCTYEEFRDYIESKFLPGMSWANFSKCHLDHIVPLCAAKTEEDVYALNHYTNLRPLWGSKNLSKHARLPEEHELPADLHPKVKEIWLTSKAR